MPIKDVIRLLNVIVSFQVAVHPEIEKACQKVETYSIQTIQYFQPDYTFQSGFDQYFTYLSFPVFQMQGYPGSYNLGWKPKQVSLGSG